MKLIPILTEKSMAEASSGKYTFMVAPQFSKSEVKKAIETTFGVKVASIKSQNLKKRVKTNLRRQKRVIPAKKKVTVSLKGKDKIDLFDTENK